MNNEQVKSALRSVVIAFGGIIAGFFAAKGWLTSDQVTAIITSETFLGIATTVIMGAWGVISKTRNKLVVTAGTVTDDKGNKLITEMKMTDPVIAKEVNAQVSASVTASRSADR